LLLRAGMLAVAARSTLPCCSPSKNNQGHGRPDAASLEAAARQPPVNRVLVRAPFAPRLRLQTPFALDVCVPSGVLHLTIPLLPYIISSIICEIKTLIYIYIYK
jgi:hypothetical protein